jgi:hypothetical protein
MSRNVLTIDGVSRDHSGLARIAQFDHAAASTPARRKIAAPPPINAPDAPDEPRPGVACAFGPSANTSIAPRRNCRK